jgi:hypothetical protein
MGDHLMPPAGDNPKGFFEDLRAFRVHEQLLSDLGAAWHRPAAIPANWLEDPATEVAERRLMKVADGLLCKASTVAVKDPRACLFVPLWQRVAYRLEARLVALVVHRKEEAIVKSLVVRNAWLPDAARRIARVYLNHLEKLDPDIPRADISFPFGLTELETWDRVARELGITLDLTRMGAVHSFLDGGLVHHG